MSVTVAYAVEWEVEGTSGFGLTIGGSIIPGGVDLTSAFSASATEIYNQSLQNTNALTLEAPPDTIVEYTVAWQELWQPGYVEVKLVDQTVHRINLRYRTGVRSDFVTTVSRPCNVEERPQPTVPVDAAATNIPLPEATATNIPPSEVQPQAPQPPQTIARLRVPGNIVEGIEFQAPESATYLFKYIGDAYSTYPLQDIPTGLPTWRTAVFVYEGPVVPWSGEAIPDGAFVRLGHSDTFLNHDEAVSATLSGHDVLRLKLEAGDILRLVAVDGQSSYGDNPGGVDLEVLLVQR
jgi:hypothetical protein